MAEPGGQHRQQPLDIGTPPVPGLEPVDSCGVSEGMQTGSASSIVGGPDACGLEQLGEGLPDGGLDEGRAVTVGEEGRGGALRQGLLLAPGGVGPQGIGELRGERYEAGLEELRVAYGQERIGQVDISDGQALCLA